MADFTQILTQIDDGNPSAAEAMRRILITRAQRRGRVMHGDEWQRVQLDPNPIGNSAQQTDLPEFDAALTRLEEKNAQKSELVKLHYFGGITTTEAAKVLGIRWQRQNRIGHMRAFGCTVN